MKELDDASAELLVSLDDRQDQLWRVHRIRIWVFWPGKDSKVAKTWLKNNGIKRIGFARITNIRGKLREWNLDPEARATGILASRTRKALAIFPDLSAKRVAAVEKTLADLLEVRK